MFNRNYFESVLLDQMRLLDHAAHLSVQLASGESYDVWALIAAHDGYVILEVHSDGTEPERSKAWRDRNPDANPWIFDQLAIPYGAIVRTILTARSTEVNGNRPIGFHQDIGKP